MTAQSRSRLVYEPVVSVDGFAAGPDGDISWHASDGFELMTPDQLVSLEQVGAILLGARTYRLFADYWPFADPAEQQVAGPMNALPKHVLSASLREAPWGGFAPAEVHPGDPEDVLERLRESTDGDIILWGSVSLAASLARRGQIDVLRLRTVPTVLGRGVPFLPEDVRLPLSLVRTVSFAGGHTVVEYDVRTSTPH